jgi:GT2 family glycosyltransferase
MKTAIIIPVHNALPSVLRCLDSIGALSQEDVDEIVLVDDHSDEATRVALKTYADARPHVQLLVNSQHLGYNESVRRGVEASSADFYILLNSDTVVSGGFSRKLERVLSASPKVALVSPLSCNAGPYSIGDCVNFCGRGVGFVNEALEQRANLGHPRSAIVDFPHGFCIGIRKEVFESIGFFDNVNFPFGYGSENDYALRALRAGYLSAVCLDAFVHHDGAASLTGDKKTLVTSARQVLNAMYGRVVISRSATQVQDLEEVRRIRDHFGAMRF